MNKKTISSILAACMCVTTFAGVGVTASAENTTEYKTLFKDDFEDSTKYSGNWNNTKGTDFAYSEVYMTNGTDPGERLKGDYAGYYYNYNKNGQKGNTRSYYTMGNLNYHEADRNRAIQMRVDSKKTDWFVDVKLAGRNPEYENMAVGELAGKAIDTSFLFYFKNGVSGSDTVGDQEFMSTSRATTPAKLQLVYTVNGVEKTYDLGEHPTYTTSNGTFNNGLHIRNTLKGILADNEPQDTASNIRIRFTGKIEDGLTELGFDNFLIKEVNPKEVFSEDFEERAWFGEMRSTDILTDISTTNAIDSIDMTGRGSVLKLKTTSNENFNHTMIFPILNADPTKCYKVALDMYFPTTNADTKAAEVWVKDVASKSFKTLIKVNKNSNFEHFEGVFDFSNTPEVKSKTKNLVLLVKYGDGANAVGDALYIDNITVTEMPFKDISANQGTNWFGDKNTLANGELNIAFRNTEKECVGIVAEYKADGTLNGLSMTDVGTAESAKKTVTVTDDIKKVSAYMWNMNDITPEISGTTLTKPE